MPNLYDLERIRELELAELERGSARGHGRAPRPRTGPGRSVAAQLRALAERLAPVVDSPAGGTLVTPRVLGAPVGRG